MSRLVDLLRLAVRNGVHSIASYIVGSHIEPTRGADVLMCIFMREGDRREIPKTQRQEFRSHTYRKFGQVVGVRTVSTKVESSSVRARSVEKHDLIADNLNTRVLSLQARATMIYWTILATLAVGVILVIFAGYLSSFDTESNLLWSRLDTEMSIAHYPTGNGEAVKRYSKHYDDVLNASIFDMNARNNQGRIWNWSSTILRVSVAGLLIFLVQILMQLYRYNSLLIVFYSSRRDAIIMSGGDLKAAQQWEAVFAPANLDFGKEPRHPFQAIASLFGKGKLSDDEPSPHFSKGVGAPGPWI